MGNSDGAVSLAAIMIGDAKKLRSISRRLQAHSNLDIVASVESAEYVYGIIRRCLGDGIRVNTIFLDQLADCYDPHKSPLFILETRTEYPDIVFVLLASETDLQSRRQGFFGDSGQGWSLLQNRSVAQCRTWHMGTVDHPGRRCYEYDVAISFAGEDRDFAGELAMILIGRDVRVFYDDDQQPFLLGKNLYTTLYDIYACKCRFCLILVSKAYRDKIWPNRERAAAQARALEMREQDYILPIRLEDVSIQGLPPTVAYVSASLGAKEIANLLVRKLALVSWRNSRLRSQRAHIWLCPKST